MATPRVAATVSFRLPPSRLAKAPKITRKTIDKAVRSVRPYEGGHTGRGITICAGGFVYFSNAWVLLRILRKHGCGLPIQFWYYGDREMDDRMKKMVAPYGVECVDARKVARRAGRKVGQGWPLKPFSILHSPFEEVLAIDADNIPIRNPEYLFESNGYLETGAIFWPDVGSTAPEKQIWRTMDVPYRNEPEFESGQIVVNKALCWEPLNLAMWMNEPERAEHFYKLVWGDKDTFRFAWHKFGFPFAMTPVPIQMLSVQGGPCCSGVMCQHDLEGERIFQHRNLLKWQLYGDNPWVPGYFFEGECREYLAELRSMWNGRIGSSKILASPRIAQWRRKLVRSRWILETIKKPTLADTPTVPIADQGAGFPPPDVPVEEEALLPVGFNGNPGDGDQGEPAENGGLASMPDMAPIAMGTAGAEAIAGPALANPTTPALPTDPWPAPKQRAVRELRFDPAGHCGDTSMAHATFWDLEEDAAGLSLKFSDREGVGKPGARLRFEPDGTWRGRFHDGAEKATLRLSLLDAMYPSASDSGGRSRKNGSHRVLRTLHVYHSAKGIGDHIAGLYACAGAANAGVRVIFHTRVPEWLERVRHPGVAVTGELPAKPERAIDLNHDSGSQQRHGLNRAAWYADAIEPGLKPARPDFVDREIHVPRFDFDRYVVVAPFSAWARRNWTGANWTRLTHLLRGAGYEVVAIGIAKDAERFDKVFGQTTALWAIEHPPEWVADAMLGAACVIGNDSGMTHFAGLLDVPTLAIHAHLPPEFLFAGTSVRSITPKTNCTFCRWQHDRGYNSACDAARRLQIAAP